MDKANGCNGDSVGPVDLFGMQKAKAVKQTEPAFSEYFDVRPRMQLIGRGD